MLKSKHWMLLAAIAAGLATVPLIAQNKDKKDAKAPTEPDMAAMMELAKPGDNHKLLARGVGDWTYQVKMWMDPSAPPSESAGVSVCKEVMGGRYYITEHTGKMSMPGPDGKMMEMEFKGMATEGYDNIKKKFVSTWIDNMGTMIMVSEGNYEPASKTFTYHTECEMMPGMKTKIREVIKVVDNDNRVFQFFENRGGEEVKTMEITYKRKK